MPNVKYPAASISHKVQCEVRQFQQQAQRVKPERAALRMKLNVQFAADVTIRCYDEEQTVKQEHTSNPVCPTMHSFPTRARAFNSLFHGYPDGMHALELPVKENRCPHGSLLQSLMRRLTRPMSQ